jgi:MoaA/NifB/PqqE/SkfB family radical SAM enzyme
MTQRESERGEVLRKGRQEAFDVRLLRDTPESGPIDPDVAALARRLAPAFYLDVGNVCNQHCLYCAVPRQKAYRTSCGDAERIVDAALRHGFDTAALIGGEPTIWPHLQQMLHYMRRAGVRRVILATNGLMLAYPDFLRQVVEGNVDTVGLSIDDFDPATQALLTRHPQNPGILAQALDNLAASPDVDTYLYTVLTGTLRGRMAEHIGKCRELAARFRRRPAFVFAGLKPVETAGEQWDRLAITLTETAALVGEAVEGLAGEATVAFRDIPLCLVRPWLDHSLDLAHRQAAVEVGSGEQRPAPLARDRSHAPACDGCRLRDPCPAIYDDYRRRYGDGELETID